MKAQNHTLRLEIPLKPICLVSGKVPLKASEELFKSQTKVLSGKPRAWGLQLRELSSFAWCEVLTTSARSGARLPLLLLSARQGMALQSR